MSLARRVVPEEATLTPAEPWIVRCDDPPPFELDLLGAKAHQLAHLRELGLPVPEWFALTAPLCLEVAQAGRLSPAQLAAVLEVFDGLLGPGARVAVRSSAVEEDGAAASFAGQLESFLHVRRAGLARAIEACVASARSERVRWYRRARGLPSAPLRIAVLVQRMVDSAVSGVAFTADPVSGDRSAAVITAGLGLGEGVVQSQVECDTFRVSLQGGRILDREVRPKRSRVELDGERGDGTRLAQVPEAEGGAPALEDEELRAIVAAGRAVQQALGAPVDLEWALDAGRRLHVLQARPITSLPPPPERHTTVLDSSNIVESYPGLVAPLTFTFARDAYERTFREAARRFGIPAPLLRERASTFGNLVSYVDGRVYYNLLSWYRLYRLVPGFEGALPAWEKALGIQGERPQDGRRPRRAPLTSARVALRIARQYAGLERDVDQLLSRVAALEEAERNSDLPSEDAHALLDRLEALGRELFEPFAVGLVNDFFAQQLYALAERLIGRWTDLAPQALLNALFCGDQRMDSLGPLVSLVELASLARLTPEVEALLLRQDLPPGETWARLRSGGARTAAFRAALEDHLRKYRDRTVQELKLETLSLDEDPAPLLAALRSCLQQPGDVRTGRAGEDGVRRDGEERLRRALAGHPVRRRVLRRVLEAAGRSVRFRENLRLARSRAFGMARRIFRALGHRLAQAGVLEGADDVFFLAQEEIAGAVRGHGVTSDLQALVALRRLELEACRSREVLPRRTFRGMAAAPIWMDEAPAAGTAAPAKGGPLSGIGCGGGVARGTAKVVLDPGAGVDVRGEILV
ncbi:MAG TPA: PEP/pyruvate-binding domain-containing protein, partial [Myxococcales bacterium]|nr:PEP/pyruvate-binding domain-containing protein [Myxococcales bacterium]